MLGDVEFAKKTFRGDQELDNCNNSSRELSPNLCGDSVENFNGSEIHSLVRSAKLPGVMRGVPGSFTNELLLWDLKEAEEENNSNRKSLKREQSCDDLENNLQEFLNLEAQANSCEPRMMEIIPSEDNNGIHRSRFYTTELEENYENEMRESEGGIASELSQQNQLCGGGGGRGDDESDRDECDDLEGDSEDLSDEDNDENENEEIIYLKDLRPPLFIPQLATIRETEDEAAHEMPMGVNSEEDIGINISARELRCRREICKFHQQLNRDNDQRNSEEDEDDEDEEDDNETEEEEDEETTDHGSSSDEQYNLGGGSSFPWEPRVLIRSRKFPQVQLQNITESELLNEIEESKEEATDNDEEDLDFEKEFQELLRKNIELGIMARKRRNSALELGEEEREEEEEEEMNESSLEIAKKNDEKKKRKIHAKLVKLEDERDDGGDGSLPLEVRKKTTKFGIVNASGEVSRPLKRKFIFEEISPNQDDDGDDDHQVENGNENESKLENMNKTEIDRNELIKVKEKNEEENEEEEREREEECEELNADEKAEAEAEEQQQKYNEGGDGNESFEKEENYDGKMQQYELEFLDDAEDEIIEEVDEEIDEEIEEEADEEQEVNANSNVNSTSSTKQTFWKIPSKDEEFNPFNSKTARCYRLQLYFPLYLETILEEEEE